VLPESVTGARVDDASRDGGDGGGGERMTQEGDQEG